MLKIGLTGGIGCGKTTVTQLFAALNVPIIDADTIAHRLVAPGQPALAQIRQTFGKALITAEGALDRKKMRDLIFSEGSAKHTLEAILHPLIYSTMQEQIAALQEAPYCIISVPLLFESKMEAIADRILVVDCPVEQQIERIKKRENMTLATIQAIIASQTSREIKLSKADDVIDNAEMETNLIEQVNTLHNLYISLSTL